ncbi:MAG TPA: sugar transferase [Euzebyales bacterium]|nr:sugar transferase [Euzebyales bacterium]
MNPSDPHDPTRPPGATRRRALALADAATVALGWLVLVAVLWVGDPERYRPGHLLTWLVVATAVTAVVLAHEQLYLSRVLTIRAVEVQRVGRACLIAGVVLAVLDRLTGAVMGVVPVGVGALLTYALLLVSRVGFQGLAQGGRRRAQGRSLLLADSTHDARRTLELLRARPQLGYRIVGYVCAQRPDAQGDGGDLGVPWLGTPKDLALLTELTAVTSVVMVAGALDPVLRRAVLSELRVLDVHLHVAIDDGEHQPSIRVLPLLHRGAPAIDEPQLTHWQRAAKRGFDLVAGGVLALVALPVLAVSAALLKLTTGGPVLVRDTRLGPNGERIVVTRLRTSDLPPRRWARLVGRVCRRLCIDELPQLGNVLAGSMSLVGPRPQRPQRQPACAEAPVGVHAGLIGLRHVEARDYPEHGPYRRLDQFYAENWSLGLDVSIVAASATHVLWRSAREAIRGDEHAVVG